MQPIRLALETFLVLVSVSAIDSSVHSASAVGVERSLLQSHTNTPHTLFCRVCYQVYTYIVIPNKSTYIRWPTIGLLRPTTAVMEGQRKARPLLKVTSPMQLYTRPTQITMIRRVGACVCTECRSDAGGSPSIAEVSCELE